MHSKRQSTPRRAWPSTRHNTSKGTSQAWIAPSLLSADFSKLSHEIKEIESAGADWVHFDVMDGHFVPNLTFGPPLVKALRPHTSLPFDCHLMVSEPEKWIEPFARAGANWITVHVEATPHLHRVITQIKEAGCKAGISLNPATPLGMLEAALDWVDLVLVMSVNPGFGGQKFIPESLEKVKKLAALRRPQRSPLHSKKERNFLIEVDGGIDTQNIQSLYQAGADVFVAGSSIFGKPDRHQAIQYLKGKLKR